MVHISSIQPKQPRKNQITFAPSEAKTGAELCPAIVCRIVTGNVPVSYWPIFFPVLLTIPEVFAKVNSFYFPSRFKSDELLF